MPCASPICFMAGMAEKDRPAPRRTHRTDSPAERAKADFRRAALVLAAFTAAIDVLLLAQPIYMLQVYDRVLPAQSRETLLFLSLAMGLSLLVLALLDVVRSFIASRAAARFDASLSDHVLRSLIRGGAAGEGAQPLRDIEALRALISSRALFALFDLPFSAVFVLMMYLVHPCLFWLTLLGAVALTSLAVVNQLAIAAANRTQSESSVAAGARAEHMARAASSIVAMGMLSAVVNDWGRLHAAGLAAADRAAAINAWFAGFSKFLRLALQTAVLACGALLVIGGEITAGMIFAASLISGRALQPIDQIIGSWRQLAAGQHAWRRLRGFLARAGEERRHTSLPPPKGRLEVEDLFEPDPADPARPPILARIGFALEPGEVVAMLGPSGAGKSTLARMLVGAARPKSGRVRLDGHDLAHWDAEALGRHIGYLAQDVELLPGTVAENIARFDPAAEDEAIIAAARAAHAEDLVQRLPGGYDTLLGPGGVQLSGGERQRIALARAFYGSPRLIVLDEPNSNLDRAGETALMRAIAGAKRKGAAVLVVTQRESLLAAADKIMRIHNGSLLDFGARDAVLSRHQAPPGAGARQAAVR